MAKKRTKINLSQPIQPRGGDLEQLFATEGDAEQAAGLQLLAVRVDAIDPDPDQPRSTFNDDSLHELAESIRQDGVIQPIEVTQSSPGRYLIVHGERRWRASQLAGLATVPAVVRRRDYDDVTRFVRQVVVDLLPEFATALDPIYQEAKSKNVAVSPYFNQNSGRVADVLLAITDAKAARSKSGVVKGAYDRLRGTAKKNVEAAVPRLGKVIEKHAG